MIYINEIFLYHEEEFIVEVQTIIWENVLPSNGNENLYSILFMIKYQKLLIGCPFKEIVKKICQVTS